MHLEEPLLGVHVALRARQVGDAVAEEVGDAAAVAHHGHVAGEPGDRRGALGLREGVAHRRHDDDRRNQGQHDHDGEDADGRAEQPPGGAPSSRPLPASILSSRLTVRSGLSRSC